MNIRHEASSPCSCEQIYALVGDIDRYHDFIPWCAHSKVLKKESDEVWAKLDIAYRVFSLSFTTVNRMRPHQSIVMDLQESNKQLRSLHGEWTFEPGHNGSCHIALLLELQFAHPVIAITLKPLFEHIGATLVQAFVKRAEYVYATQ